MKRVLVDSIELIKEVYTIGTCDNHAYICKLYDNETNNYMGCKYFSSLKEVENCINSKLELGYREIKEVSA